MTARGPWAEIEACLAGPPGMVRTGVRVGRNAGIQPERIRRDAGEELVGPAPV
ncbi:hypothetical protein [uncultured Streptomyces sp.]|uniref:hypothetical protein n=1 Tax=uncultured Streptomyces sp. TaxID=174707 RepID=UPI0026185479|nr:hypothetical protein [uncultured Streptomyces sp.]